MFKKKIPWMVAFFLFAGLSIFMVISMSKSFSMEEMLSAIKNSNPVWMGCAIVSMLLFIVFEGFAIQNLINKLSGKKKSKRGMFYSATDIYFSAITPSATGGQPASALFMICDGISSAHTAVILLINLIMYTIALIVIGLLGFLLDPKIFMQFSVVAKCFISLGYIFLFFLCAFFMMILKKDSWIKKLSLYFINLAYKLHIIKNKEKRIKKLDNMIIQYHEATIAMRGKSKLLYETFIFNFLQRISSISTVVFVYLALGGKYCNILDVFCVQALVIIGSNSIPVPGAMGIADYLMLDGFRSISGIDSITNLELVSRGISFYACVLVSAVILIIGYILTKIRNKEDL